MSPEEACPQQLEQLSALGTLLAAERRQAYLAIVEALVALREGFNSEPLTDEVAAAVSELYAGEGGGREAFLRDLKQLTVWGLVTERIERVRLRGYRDNRREKFRYRLCPLAIHFIAWLHEERDAVGEEMIDATRRRLDTLYSELDRTRRTLRKSGASTMSEETAADLLCGLQQAMDLTNHIKSGLDEMRQRLLSAADALAAEQDDASQIVEDLQLFLSEYLQNLRRLRGLILGVIGDLQREDCRKKWEAAEGLMARRLRRTRALFRPKSLPTPAAILAKLKAFYGENGALDAQCRAIGAAVREVLAQVCRRVRELSRRSTRLEDLRALFRAVADFPGEALPMALGDALLQPFRLYTDKQPWDDDLRAFPPEPKRPLEGRRRLREHTYLPPSTPGEERPISSQEARLQALLDWLEAKGWRPNAAHPVTHALAAELTTPEDLANLFGIGCAGALHQGAALHRRGLRVGLDSTRRLQATAHTPTRRLTLDAPETTFAQE